jgi:hypothetical protein
MPEPLDPPTTLQSAEYDPFVEKHVGIQGCTPRISI